MTSVLVYSNDQIGATMAGPGIRYYHCARELARQFDVTLMIPNEPAPELDGLEVMTAPTRAQELHRALEPFDAIVTQLLPRQTIEHVARAEKRVIYDLYNPFLAETLASLDVEGPERAALLFARTTRIVQRLALLTGSAFVCASERQRDLWLGVLAALGRIDLDAYRRDPGLRELIDVVPFGLPSEIAQSSGRVLKGVVPGIGEGDRVLLWAGGIWNWLDPLTVIRAVGRIAERRDDVKLLFLGLRHPDPLFPQSAMAERAVELARSLDLLDRFVFFNPAWTPYERRHSFLLEADLGVSAHFDTLETRYAFRTRLLDHFWTGLPTVATRGDVLSDLVVERGLGRTVGFEDVDGWVRAIEQLVDDDGLRQRCAQSFARVRAELAWPTAVEPLARLVRTARPARSVPWRARRTAVEEGWVRVRTSFALGGPRGFIGRQARKLASRETGAR